MQILHNGCMNEERKINRLWVKVMMPVSLRGKVVRLKPLPFYVRRNGLVHPQTVDIFYGSCLRNSP
jgi:hypothetical protein